MLCRLVRTVNVPKDGEVRPFLSKHSSSVPRVVYLSISIFTSSADALNRFSTKVTVVPKCTSSFKVRWRSKVLVHRLGSWPRVRSSENLR